MRGPQSYDGFDVNLRDVGELTPAVAVLAALATPGSVSRLTGVAHLRGHETDRLAALSTEINRLGGDCSETPDGLEITATPLRPGTWQSYADHRMATGRRDRRPAGGRCRGGRHRDHRQDAAALSPDVGRDARRSARDDAGRRG